MAEEHSALIALDVQRSIWESFFSVFPLVVVGSREENGSADLAPKHLAMPMSWENHFGFICTPAHATYRNIKRTGEFTVTYPRPSQVVLASLTATPRCSDGSKAISTVLPTFKAEQVDGVFLADGYLFLECRLKKIYDDFGSNSLITGNIVSARVAADALRASEADDLDLVGHSPLLAYLYPGRFSEISASTQLPFPKDFKR